MCKVFEVNISSYYHWIKSACVIKKEDKQLNNRECKPNCVNPPFIPKSLSVF